MINKKRFVFCGGRRPEVQKNTTPPSHPQKHLQPAVKLPKIAQSVYDITDYEYAFIRFDLVKKLILEMGQSIQEWTK